MKRIIYVLALFILLICCHSRRFDRTICLFNSEYNNQLFECFFDSVKTYHFKDNDSIMFIISTLAFEGKMIVDFQVVQYPILVDVDYRKTKQVVLDFKGYVLLLICPTSFFNSLFNSSLHTNDILERQIKKDSDSIKRDNLKRLSKSYVVKDGILILPSSSLHNTMEGQNDLEFDFEIEPNFFKRIDQE